MTTPSPQWIEDSKRWRGKVLVGKYGHWCDDYDGLPVDETCPEWPCACAEAVRKQVADEEAEEQVLASAPATTSSSSTPPKPEDGI